MRITARVRSSSGSRTKRASANKSITASCSVSTIRSVPATGISASLSARTMLLKKLFRLCTRIMISRGAIGRPVALKISPFSSQRRICSAIFFASCAAGLLSRFCAKGISQGSVASISGGFTVGQISTSPASPVRRTKCLIVSPAAVRPRRAVSSAKTRSTRSRTASVDRKERSSGTFRQSLPALPARSSNSRRITSKVAGSAP